METQTTARDSSVTSFALALTALALGIAVDQRDGTYSVPAILFLTVGLLFCIFAIVRYSTQNWEAVCAKNLPILLAAGVLLETVLLMGRVNGDSQIQLGVMVIAGLGMAQFLDRRNLRLPLIILMALTFFFAGSAAFNRHAGDPGIDVFTFQQDASYALVHGVNPYSFRYPNLYGPGTPFYGPGVVSADGKFLNFGFPYPPLSLLMVFPFWLVLGDVRYAHVLAMGITACLMAMARPGKAGRVAAIAGTLFLLTPRAVYVTNCSWTEPLLALTLSLVMFSACRRSKLFPYALGLFLATKQYSVLALPLLPLIVTGEDRYRKIGVILFKAAIVLLIINLPFLLWNPRDFFRALVELQLVQPFRRDALSYLVWFYRISDGTKLPAGVSILALVPAYALAFWRCPRTVSGFAAGLTFVLLAFFAFNKQAFCNYYYFVIATACWAIASAVFADVKVNREVTAPAAAGLPVI